MSRMFIATVKLDSCECLSCGARWDEDVRNGEYRGRGARSSVLMKRPL